MKKFISDIIDLIKNELTKEEIIHITIDTVKATLSVVCILILFAQNLSLGISLFIFSFVMCRRKVRRLLKAAKDI